MIGEVKMGIEKAATENYVKVSMQNNKWLPPITEDTGPIAGQQDDTRMVKFKEMPCSVIITYIDMGWIIMTVPDETLRSYSLTNETIAEIRASEGIVQGWIKRTLL